MKKIIIIMLISILFTSNTLANNYTLTKSDKYIVNKLSYKISNLLEKNNLSFRIKLKEKINDIQKKYKNNKKMYLIFEEIKKNNYLISNKTEYTKHYQKFNININKIKQDWLLWHNQARSSLWRSKYSYDDRLNSTAFEWSKEQDFKWKMTHERVNWDWYYNYPKVEKWFNKRGVKCKISWGATSSESIWKYWYYCKDNDCTDELSKSLKVIFDIYMSEKWLWYPADAHYKWITLPSLNKIWLWIYLKENFNDTYLDFKSYDYYVTTHYCTNFKK